MSTDKSSGLLSDLIQQRRQQQGEIPRPTSATNRSAPTRPTSVLSNHSSSATTNNSKQHKLSKRFTVIRKLGKGTYGKVQLAINKESGQEVAIKTIKKSKIDNEADMQRVRREIQIMRSIEHPHIIHIYEEFENKDKIVLIMQYAPGGELYEYVSQSKALDDGEARRLFRQIATAIYYCHQNKICHRDLKLENILLDEKNNAKLADFGLSNVFDKQSQLATFCGSPLYASPEIVQGSPYKGPEVDCWSLGVLLYTLVYGAMPFDGSNFKRLVKQISEASYYEPAERSQASPLIRQLLCADPQKRATIIDICSDPWVNGASGTPLSPLVRPTQKTANEISAPSSQHPSLLKVAQDMANLTPVRIDMLLELTMGEKAARQQREAEASARSPLAPIIDNNNNTGKSPSPHQMMRLDPSSVMEVDESRATSPIASYVVRDLDQPSEWTQPCKEEAPPIQDIAQEAHQNKLEQDEGEEEIVEFSVEQAPIVVVEEREPQQLEIKDSTSISQPADEKSTTEEQPPMAATNESVLLDSMEVESMAPREAKELESHAHDHEQQVNSVQARGSMQSEEITQMEVEQPAAASNDATELQISSSQELEKKPQEAAADNDKISPSAIEDKDAASEPCPVETADDQEAAAPASKPKKVKKKIIVVKKKKKVSKKLDAGEDEQQLAEQTSDKKNASEHILGASADGDKQEPERQAATDEAQQTVVNKQQSRPGKVKIPNTFQAVDAQEQQQTQTPASQQQGRRQSALIADVSQRLLQSVSAEPRAANITESDQLQLKNVRVSDKKDELERRASLAAQQQAELLPAAAGSQRSHSISPAPAPANEASAAEQQVEALQAELVREMQSSCASDKAEMGLIRRLEPRSVGPATLIAPAAAGGRANKTESALASDEGNDSPETIKAEIAKSTGSRRRSLHVDLSPLRDVCHELLQNQEASKTPSTASSGGATGSASGPAPIARSYKKVTFTKDGACITETSKIYSTQADDGTLRRVERKSKITHYPAAAAAAAAPGTDGDSTRGSRTNFHKERVVYAATSDKPHSKQRHFERLIMPSRLATSEPIDDDDDDDDFLASFTTGDSPFDRTKRQQQRDRTGSASSCSSGSTDVLEDIFDTWTGAVSMFNRPSSRLFERLSSAGSFGARHRRQQHHQQSSSQAATPRCESVEPQLGAGRGHEARNFADLSQKQRHQQSSSGYESDAAGGSHQRRSQQRRPARGAPRDAPSSARGLFGSWNLLNELEHDDFSGGGFPSFGLARKRNQQHESLFSGGFDRDPFEILEREQRSLRERLAQQHKQLWRGSTPSLLDELAPGESAASKKPPTSATTTTTAKDPRLPKGGRGGVASESGGQRVGQSQSSSSFSKAEQPQTATPLMAAPIRKNTSNISATFAAAAAAAADRESTSLSKTATAESLSQSGGKHRHATSFIELKRTSSSLGSQSVLRSSSSKLRIKQQQLDSASNNSCSSFWLNQRETPPMASFDQSQAASTTTATISDAVPALVAEKVGPGSQQAAGESVNRRVQSWLQESSGNLSATSSGSRSSQSASLHSGRRAHDPFENLYGSLWQTTTAENSTASSSRSKIQDSLVASSGLPPLTSGRNNRSNNPLLQQSEMEHKQQLAYSASGNSLLSKQKSTLESAQCATQDPLNNRMLSTIEQSHKSEERQLRESAVIRDGSSTKIATTRASSFVVKQTLGQTPTRTVSPLLVGPAQLGNETPTTTTTTTTATSQREQQFKWSQQEVKQTSCSARVLTCDPFDVNADSLSASGDLESRSSSSLLDQLKAGGYRSMINKRMVDVSELVTAKSSSAAKVIEELEAAKVASTSIVHESYTRSSTISQTIQQQKQQQGNNEIDDCDVKVEDEGEC